MPERKRVLRRGEIIGQRVGGELKSEAEHYIKCPTCGTYVDMRDLAQVLEHDGPLPHPACASNLTFSKGVREHPIRAKRSTCVLVN